MIDETIIIETKNKVLCLPVKSIISMRVYKFKNKWTLNIDCYISITTYHYELDYDRKYKAIDILNKYKSFTNKEKK